MPEEKYVDNRYSHQQEQNEEHKSQLIKQGGGKQRLVGTYVENVKTGKISIFNLLPIESSLLRGHHMSAIYYSDTKN